MRARGRPIEARGRAAPGREWAIPGPWGDGTADPETLPAKPTGREAHAPAGRGAEGARAGGAGPAASPRRA
jgi:hypothetical protein